MLTLIALRVTGSIAADLSELTSVTGNSCALDRVRSRCWAGWSHLEVEITLQLAQGSTAQHCTALHVWTQSVVISCKKWKRGFTVEMFQFVRTARGNVDRSQDPRFMMTSYLIVDLSFIARYHTFAITAVCG
jgi:hypothetical protein